MNALAQNANKMKCKRVAKAYMVRGEGGIALPDNGGDAICNSAKNKHTRKMTGNKQNAPLVFPRVACACVCAVKVSKTRTARQSRQPRPFTPTCVVR